MVKCQAYSIYVDLVPFYIKCYLKIEPCLKKGFICVFSFETVSIYVKHHMYLESVYVYPLTVPFSLHRGSVYVGTWEFAMWVKQLEYMYIA